MKIKKNSADYDAKLSDFQDKIGFYFTDIKLLEEALTHSSYANESALPFFNERLEFLGDAVLELISSDKLYREHNETDEGGLTRLRSRLVCKESLARWADGIGLRPLIKLGRSLIKNGPTESVEADAAEAVFGAVYLDGGYEAARSVVVKFLETQGDCEPSEVIDAKTELQQLFQSKGSDVPYYKTIERKGPDHAKKFKVKVTVDGEKLAEAWGDSIKDAEFNAAKAALKNI